MRTLCYVNHYYGPSQDFRGGSTWSEGETRRKIVERCIEGLRQLPGAEVKVCGIPEFALVPVDIDLSGFRDRPRTLIYEGLAHMASAVDDYDYFVAVEDDILVPQETFQSVIAFDRSALLNEVLHPNRVEFDPSGTMHVIDIYQAFVGWTYMRRPYAGSELRVALNPHSGVLILSQEKLRYALDRVDREFRGRFIAQEMESAFAYLHSPFLLYRNYSQPRNHIVIHMDPHPSNWTPLPMWRRVARSMMPPAFRPLVTQARRVVGRAKRGR